MSGLFTPDLTVTGAAADSLTTPTYTMVPGQAPSQFSKRWIVSALGGTQTNVRTHTAGDPFQMTIKRDPYKSLPSPNPVTGSYPNVPLNRTEVTFEKGLMIDAAGTIRPGRIRVIEEIPAGAEYHDAVNIQAMNSMGLGQLQEEAAELSNTVIVGSF